jgi:putative ABC transport system substrate-binding protein
MNHLRRRRLLRAVAGLGTIAAASYATGATAPQAQRRRRIGLLGMTSAAGYSARWTAFREGLRSLGWSDGTHVEYVERFADGELARLPELALELVRAGIDVLVTHGIPGTRAASAATRTVPIVMAAIADPVAAGLVASYAKPGGNITGTAFLAHEMAAKRMQLVREALPRAARVAVLSNPRNPLFSDAMFQAMQDAASQLRMTLQRFDAPEPAQYPQVFAEIAAKRPDALAITEEAAFNSHVASIAGLALRHRLPAIGTKDFCDAGGLVGYGADFNAMFERAAHVVDRLLRGTRPGDLPIEQPTRFEMAVNLRTARVLGVSLPDALVVRADGVVR